MESSNATNKNNNNFIAPDDEAPLLYATRQHRPNSRVRIAAGLCAIAGGCLCFVVIIAGIIAIIAAGRKSDTNPKGCNPSFIAQEPTSWKSVQSGLDLQRFYRNGTAGSPTNEHFADIVYGKSGLWLISQPDGHSSILITLKEVSVSPTWHLYRCIPPNYDYNPITNNNVTLLEPEPFAVLVFKQQQPASNTRETYTIYNGGNNNTQELAYIEADPGAEPKGYTAYSPIIGSSTTTTTTTYARFDYEHESFYSFATTVYQTSIDAGIDNRVYMVWLAMRDYVHKKQ